MRAPGNIRRIVCIFAACLGMGLAGTALAQAYPTRPIKIVVPNSPGAAADVVARLVAVEMSKTLGQAVYVENKTGASSQIAFDYVAKGAPADGYTAVVAAVTGLAILPLLTKNLPFDPLKDLKPVIGLVEAKLVLASPASAPWKTVAEMGAQAKANPGKLNHGSSNPTVRFWMDALIRDLGIDVAHIPYRDSAPFFQALATGEVQMGFLTESSALTLGDKVRILGVTGERPSALYPNAPTFISLGYPKIRGVGYAMFVAAATPKAVVDKLQAAAAAAVRVEEVKTRLAGQYMEVDGGSTEAAGKRLAEEAAVLADIAKSIGIEPQ